MSAPITPRTVAHRALALLFVLLSLPLTALADDDTGFYFSYYTTGVYIKELGSFEKPKLTVPDDYKGTPVYSSSNTDMATVDAATGEVSYVGAGKGVATHKKNADFKLSYDLCGDVVITASLPADGGYAAREVQYHIFYCNKKKVVRSMTDWNALDDETCTQTECPEPEWTLPGPKPSTVRYRYFVYIYNTYLVDVQTDLTFSSTKGSRGNVDVFGYVKGNGHTFTVDYQDVGDSYAPIKSLVGVVNNLKITGSIYLPRSIHSYHCAGLAMQVLKQGEEGSSYYYPKIFAKPEAIIDNCYNDVSFKQDGWAMFGSNNTWMGGFVYKVYDNNSVTFRDCILSSKVNYKEFEQFGGFVTDREKGATVTFENCAADLHDNSASSTDDDLGFFIGKDKGKDTGKTYVTNCYYRPSSGKNPDVLTDTKKISSSEMTDGTLAYALGAGRTHDANPWRQTLGTDSGPHLKGSAPKSLEVFFKPATSHTTTAGGWSAMFFPTNISLPANVIPYVVTGVNEEDHTVAVSSYQGNTKYVPLLLYTDGDAQTINVPQCYYNQVSTDGRLRGVFDDLSSGDDCRMLDPSTGTFVKSTTASIPAWSSYLTGATADTYTIDQNGDYGIVCRIASKDDWNEFCKNYSGKRTTVYLDTDLALTDDDRRIWEFYGILDGQGHSITVSGSLQEYVFNTAVADIRNVRFAGEEGNITYSFVQTATGDLTFSDCLALSDFCVSWYSGANVTYSHSLEYLRDHGNSKWWAAYGENGNLKAVATEKIESGEAAYRLNDGRTGDDAVWKQTIGEDDMPQLMSQTSKEVFYAEGGTREASTTDKWATLFYPAEVELPEGVTRQTPLALRNDTLLVCEYLSGNIPAETPTLLYAPEGMPELTLPEVYYNKSEEDTWDEFVGCYAATTVSPDTARVLGSGAADEARFTTAETATSVPAWQCYLVPDTSEDGVELYDRYTVWSEGVWIMSKDEWNTFKTKYDNRRVDAQLLVPLTLTDADEPMAHFKGTFDCSGLTITTSGNPLFQTAEGTIRYAFHEGTQPLVSETADSLSFSDVKTTGSPLLGKAAHAVTFEHSLSDMRTNTDKRVDAFVSNIAEGAAVHAGSSYVWGNTCANAAQAPVATDEQMQSGEAAYALNAGRAGSDAMWQQIIGTDDGPQLYSFQSEEVFMAEAPDSLSAAGWGTFFYPRTVKKPTGISAYTFAGVEQMEGTTENVAILKAIEGDSIPGYTPVILCSLAEGENSTKALPLGIPNYYYNHIATDSLNVDTTQTYVLIGVSNEMEAVDGTYVLQRQKGVTAFYRVDASVGLPTIGAWKCYLLHNTAQDDTTGGDAGDTGEQTQSVRLSFDKPATSISPVSPFSSLDALMGDGHVYDLSGRRVTTLRKGEVYVRNGAKFIVR